MRYTGLSWRLEAIGQDVRYALRGLRRSPSFTAVALATLALGIGANTAVVSALDRLMIRTPPGVHDAAHVWRVAQRFTVVMTHRVMTRDVFSYPDVDAIAHAVPSGTSVAAYAAMRESLGDGPGARDAGVTYVVGDYFSVLGVRPALGRFFARGEYGREDLTKLAVISDRLWHLTFARSPAVIGRSITVGSHRFTVIGVAPAAFHGVTLDESDIWIPYNASGDWTNRAGMYDKPMDLRLQAVIHVADAQRLDEARNAIAGSFRPEPMVDDRSAVLVPVNNLIDSYRDEGTSSILFELAGAASIILLVACTNVATLLLVRAARRRREIAIRFALGVSRGRLMTQMAIESFLLAASAAAVALLAGAWGSTVLRNTLVPRVQWGAPTVGLRLIATVGAFALVSGLAAGVLPVLHMGRHDLADGLRSVSRDTTRRGARTRAATIVVQTALSVVLLAGAGLFVRSFFRVEATWVPSNAGDVGIASIVSPSISSETDAQVPALIASASLMAERISHLRGVNHVASSIAPWIRGEMNIRSYFANDDSAKLPPGVQTTTDVVSPDFFNVRGIRLLRGRAFTADDRQGAPPVIVVGERMAQLYWPGQDAIGQCLVLNGVGPCRRVVGVVSDTHDMKVIETPSAKYYVPLAQETHAPFDIPRSVAFRVAPDQLRATLPAVRQILSTSVDHGITWDLTTFSAVLEPELRPWRLMATLFAVLGTLAALVAGVGIYGVVAYATSQRTHEIGVRRALGAERGHILRLVVGDGMRPVLAGIGLGLALAIAGGRLASAFLYGESAHDPLMLVAGAMMLVVVAALACVVPSIAALRVNPTVALAAE